MSMFSLMNCTEPSHRRNRPPDGWSLWKFDIEVVVHLRIDGALPIADLGERKRRPALLPPRAIGVRAAAREEACRSRAAVSAGHGILVQGLHAAAQDVSAPNPVLPRRRIHEVGPPACRSSLAGREFTDCPLSGDVFNPRGAVINEPCRTGCCRSSTSDW